VTAFGSLGPGLYIRQCDLTNNNNVFLSAEFGHYGSSLIAAPQYHAAGLVDNAVRASDELTGLVGLLRDLLP